MDNSPSDAMPAGVEHETRLLLAISKHQSQQAYAELFELMAPKIKSFLMGRGSSSDESENIAQDAMLSVWLKANLFDPKKSSARTWVYAVVRNRMIDLQRTSTRIYRGLEKYKHEGDVDIVTNGGVTDAASHAQLQKLLQQLPQEQARSLVMSYVEGKSHQEIAVEISLPLGTVKSRIRTGFQQLQNLVNQK